MEDCIIQFYTKITMKGDRPNINHIQPIFNIHPSSTKPPQPAMSESSIQLESLEDISPKQEKEQSAMEPKSSSSVSLSNKEIRRRVQVCQLKARLFFDSLKAKTAKVEKCQIEPEAGQKLPQFEGAMKKIDKKIADQGLESELKEVRQRMAHLEKKNLDLEAELGEAKRKITGLTRDGLQTRERLFNFSKVYNEWLEKPGVLGQHENREFERTQRGQVIASHFRDEVTFKRDLRQKMRNFGF